MSSTHDTPSVLRIAGLTKRFRSGEETVEAVKNVTLTLAKGEFVAVMGASGSGKSTLLHLVAGLTQPDEGSVTIADTDIHALNDRARTLFRRQHIGLIFQAFNLIPSLTGYENIILPVLLGRGAFDGDVSPLVSELGIEHVCKRQPDSMSGGEQQRVAIGRALVTNPSLILADEPTGSLDSVNGRKLCESFRRLSQEKGTTVLMVTHNPVVAFAADRIVVLKDGRVESDFARQGYPTVQELNRHYIEIIEKSPAGAPA